MSSWRDRLYLIYTPVLGLYMINVFIGLPQLDAFLAGAAVILLVLSFPGAPRLFKVLGTGFLAAGFLFHFSAGGGITEIPWMLTDNYSLLALILMLPWMKSVFESGRFDKRISMLLEAGAADLGRMYPRSLFTSLLLTSFLNLSAAPIAQGLLRKNLKELPTKVRNAFISKATLRGNALALVWSPLEVLIALTISITGVSYVGLLPWLMLTAGLTFMIDVFWGRFKWQRETLPHAGEALTDQNRRLMVRKMAHMLTALSAFLAAVITVGNVSGLDFILTVTLVIFPFAIGWALVLGRTRRFLTLGWTNWKEKTNRMEHFFVLFLTLSFFAEALGESGVLELLRAPIEGSADMPLVLFALIMGSFIFMSLFGVHPIATIGILSGVAPLIMEFISPMSFSVLLITASIATLTVNTYGLFAQMTAMNLSENPYRISMYNLRFAAVYCLVGMGVAFLLL
ncbi:hypothetical protein [Alkalicoccus urumqiensis]|uniref:Citrate transporter-like domain-containing protein n=1 Tax=Alkalicoccus urumqiensis TaxID=1548213 RepID=A0A2P6MIH7_ALKUR|nr:hypothetical protein [Alkalicoccus urumqiensis]PRO66080.1 hypothetical protein C6I21_07220 [Alkalicoccus urumqiensis]